MHSKKSLRRILENWDIDNSLPIEEIPSIHGVKVPLCVWAIGDEFILKTGDRGKLMVNLKIAKALSKHGFVSSLPVLTKTGTEYLDGTALFTLAHRLNGSPLSKLDRFGDSLVDFGKKYGNSIGRLHKALSVVQNEILPDETNLYRSTVEWALPSVRRQNAQWSIGLNEEFFTDYIDKFEELSDRLPRQLIHRDPNPGNILFDGGEVSGFIDFDLSEVNVRLWDPCYCATSILSETCVRRYEKWLNILGSILQGYDHENKLTLEEKQAVFYVICSIQMICAAYFESQERFKSLAKTSCEMLKHIADNKHRIEQIL